MGNRGRGKKIRSSYSKLLRLTNSQGKYDRVPLDRAAPNKLLTDIEMTNLMPLSSNNIEVLGAIHLRSHQSSLPVFEGLQAALQNSSIEHIMLPVGPDHWRGVYISKPTLSCPDYKVEVFDSMGQGSASGIKSFVSALMMGNGIENYKVSYSTPVVSQKDGYSCGDFVCAYSHKKMHSLNEQSTTYWAEMINAYDEANGNKDGCLRDVSRTMIAERSRGLNRSASPVSVICSAGAREDLNQQAENTSTVNDQMALVSRFDDANLQKLWDNNAQHYGHKGQVALKALLESKDILIAKRGGAALQDADEDLAIELQCQEFESAGYKF